MPHAGNVRTIRGINLEKKEEELKSICTINGALCKHFDGLGAESHAIKGYFAIRCICGNPQGGCVSELNHWRARECAHRTNE